MRRVKDGVSVLAAAIEKIVFQNPKQFLGQSGKFKI